MISNLRVKFRPPQWAAAYRRNCGGHGRVGRCWASSFTNELVVLATIVRAPETCEHSRVTMRHISPVAFYLLFIYFIYILWCLKFDFLVFVICSEALFRLLTHKISHRYTVLIKGVSIRLIFVPLLHRQGSTIHPPLSTKKTCILCSCKQSQNIFISITLMKLRMHML